MLRLKEGFKDRGDVTPRGQADASARDHRGTASDRAVASPRPARLAPSPPTDTTASPQDVDPGIQSVRALRGLREFQSLRAEWEAIATPWASPMQSHDWVRAWAEVYGIDRDIEILADGAHPPTAIAPMVRSSRGEQRLELVGPDELGEVMDFLYSDPRSVPALVTALVDSGLPLRFWRIPADSPVVDAVKSAYRLRGIVRCQPSAGCPSLPLDDSWMDPERHLDKRRRSNLRRARRIAEDMGPLTWEILTPKPDEIEPLLEEAYAVEIAGWKGLSGSPLARTPRLGAFFRRYATAASEAGVVRVCFLRIGGRPAAMKLATIIGNRFWLLAMGYSNEFEECSPGTLLLIETIRYAALSGLRSYEFLGADEPWIRPWTQLLRPCVSLRTYPLTIPGAVALASDASEFIRAHARSLAAAVPRLQRALEQRAALSYVAGPNLEDALRACRSLKANGFRSTIGYVRGPEDTPRAIADRHVATIDAIGDEKLDCYVSVKAPELGFSRGLFREIAERARERDVALHFDALGADTVDETFSLISELRASRAKMGCTLPGRWRRSVADADRAIDLNLSVRVVKGEWADRQEHELDPRAGSSAVVDRIAGRVRRAAVATHDPSLALSALRRLGAAGTPRELEVLMGYPVRRVLPTTEAEGVPVRVYVPYGTLSPPYSLSQVKANPRILWWAVRDLCSPAKSLASRSPDTPKGVAALRGTPRGAYQNKAVVLDLDGVPKTPNKGT